MIGRHLAITVLLLAGGTVTVAAADPINLLHAAVRRASTPLILFDATRRPFDSDDEAAMEEEDCISLIDRERSSSSRLGSASWRFGELLWVWEQPRQPRLIYLLCVTPQQHRSSNGGAMQMAAALSWSGAPVTVMTVNRPVESEANDRLPTSSSDVPGSAELPGATTVTDDAIADSNPRGDSLAPGSGLPRASSVDSPALAKDSGLANWPGAMNSPAFDDGYPPIAPTPIGPADPDQMAPVPEPATWLLVGTGLAAAWRAGRKNR